MGEAPALRALMIRSAFAAVLVLAGAGFAGCSAGPHRPEASGTPVIKASPQAQAKALTTPGAAAFEDDSIVERQHFYSGVRRNKPPIASPTPHARQKTAFLTFDDGPSQSTDKILRILKNNGVQATFFVVGSDSGEGRALYKRIAADGHALGNHTFSHNYRSIYRSVEAFKNDARRLDRLLEETVGYRPDIIRFPGGSNNHLSRKAGGRGIMSQIVKAMQEDGYQYFDWNVSSTDAAAPVQDKDMIIASVLGASRGKQNIIVLMHDSSFKTTTVEALPVIIRRLKEDGFRFEKLTKSSFTFHFLE